MKLFKKHWKGIIGGLLFTLIVIIVSAAPLLAPYDPLAQSLENTLLPPSFSPASNGEIHLLGTDQLGRDELSRLMYGGRISLSVGVVAVIISGIVGVVLGLIAGYFGGWLDVLIMRLADIQLAVPSILLAIVMVAVLGSSLVNIVLVLAITGWVTYARVVRGNVLTLKEMEYIDAARCVGVGNFRMLFKHILPNTYFLVIIIGTLQMARMILLEASLSFLGLGANISVPTWGNMIGDGRSYINSAWWLCTVPGLAIVVVIVAVNMFGDWTRDALDPKLQ